MGRSAGRCSRPNETGSRSPPEHDSLPAPRCKDDMPHLSRVRECGRGWGGLVQARGPLAGCRRRAAELVQGRRSSCSERSDRPAAPNIHLRASRSSPFASLPPLPEPENRNYRPSRYIGTLRPQPVPRPWHERRTQLGSSAAAQVAFFPPASRQLVGAFSRRANPSDGAQVTLAGQDQF
jgi:hypothetical protein